MLRDNPNGNVSTGARLEKSSFDNSSLSYVW